MKRQLFSVALITLLVQLAGFGKAVLVPYYFGVGSILDGYYLAQAVPGALSGILVGFFQSAFLPSYSAALQRNEHRHANGLLGRSLVLAAVVGAALSLSIIAASSPMVAVLTGGSGGPSAVAATYALQWLAFLVALNALLDCVALALTAHGRFALAAAAPVANAFVSTAFLVAAPQLGLVNLVVGTLLGVVAQLIIVSIGLVATGARPSVNRAPGEAESIRVGVGILPGIIFAHLSVVVPSLFAARLGEGAVAALGLAARLHGAAAMVFATAASTVLLPQFARMAAAGQHHQIIDRLQSGFFPAAMVGLVAVAWIAVVGPGAIALVFERGAFDHHDTMTVATVWLWLGVGLFSSVWSVSLAKALQAVQRSRIISTISFVGLGTSATVAAVGASVGSLGIIAFSASAPAAVTALLCSSTLGKIEDFNGPAPRKTLPSGAIVFAACSFVAVCAWWLGQERLSLPLMALVSLAMALATCFVLYRATRAGR